MHWLIGIDEAGRGPLAGPVAVGAFAVPRAWDKAPLTGIRDSKQLSERQREAWYRALTTLSDVRYAVSQVGARTIDAQGIVPAIQSALARSLQKLALDPSACSVRLDGGLRAPRVYRDQVTIIHGDATDPLIAAAAILAKVTRDHTMLRLHARYPMYGFAQHKGYGTGAHYAALARHGLCPLHRETFVHGMTILRASIDDIHPR